MMGNISRNDAIVHTLKRLIRHLVGSAKIIQLQRGCRIRGVDKNPKNEGRSQSGLRDKCPIRGDIQLQGVQLKEFYYICHRPYLFLHICGTNVKDGPARTILVASLKQEHDQTKIADGSHLLVISVNLVLD